MVYLPTLLAFVLLNFGVVYAKNIGMLLAFRFITGFVGSPVLATGGASIGDMWSPRKRAYAIGIWGLFAVCGPTMGPLVGGYAVEAKGWTWTGWELIWLNAVCFVLLIFTLPETSPQVSSLNVVPLDSCADEECRTSFSGKHTASERQPAIKLFKAKEKWSWPRYPSRMSFANHCGDRSNSASQKSFC